MFFKFFLSHFWGSWQFEKKFKMLFVVSWLFVAFFFGKGLAERGSWISVVSTSPTSLNVSWTSQVTEKTNCSVNVEHFGLDVEHNFKFKIVGGLWKEIDKLPTDTEYHVHFLCHRGDKITAQDGPLSVTLESRDEQKGEEGDAFWPTTISSTEPHVRRLKIAPVMTTEPTVVATVQLRRSRATRPAPRTQAASTAEPLVVGPNRERTPATAVTTIVPETNVTFPGSERTRAAGTVLFGGKPIWWLAAVTAGGGVGAILVISLFIFAICSCRNSGRATVITEQSSKIQILATDMSGDTGTLPPEVKIQRCPADGESCDPDPLPTEKLLDHQPAALFNMRPEREY